MKTILFILSLFLFLSCSQTDVKIKNYIEENYDNNDTLIIDLREVLDVDYDIMYLFGENNSSEDIKEITGLKSYNNKWIVSDSEYRMLLIKGEKVVYEDDFEIKDIYFEETTDDFNPQYNMIYLVHRTPYYLIKRNILKRNMDGDHFWYLLENINATYRIRQIIDSSGYWRYMVDTLKL